MSASWTGGVLPSPIVCRLETEEKKGNHLFARVTCSAIDCHECELDHYAFFYFSLRFLCQNIQYLYIFIESKICKDNNKIKIKEALMTQFEQMIFWHWQTTHTCTHPHSPALTYSFHYTRCYTYVQTRRGRRKKQCAMTSKRSAMQMMSSRKS